MSEIDGLDAIEEAAKQAVREEDQQSLSEKIVALESRIAALEPLLEQKAQNPQLATELQSYLVQLKAEQSFLNISRWIVGIFAIVIEFLLVSILFLTIFYSRSPLLKSEPAVVAAIVLGLTSAIIFLIVSFIKGAFRSAGERYSDTQVPPAIETIMKAIDKLNGGNNT